MRNLSRLVLSFGCCLWLAACFSGCSGTDAPPSRPTPQASASVANPETTETPERESETELPEGQSSRSTSTTANTDSSSDIEAEEQDSANVSAEKRQIEDDAVEVEVVAGAKPEFQNPASAAEREKYAELAKPPIPERRAIDGIVSNREIEMIIEENSKSK